MSHLKAQVDAEDTIIVDSWVSKKQVRKFKRLMCWAYAPKIRYSLSTLPLTADWGTQGFDSRFLCYRGEPVTICIVGSIQAYTLSCEKGRSSTVDLTLELFRDTDRDAMVRLLEKANPPPRVLPQMCTVSLRMDSPNKEGFNAVYNAIDGFSTTYVMPDFHFSALKGRDVVMAETLLRRNVEVDGTWDNHFQLCTLSVLALSPRD